MKRVEKRNYFFGFVYFLLSVVFFPITFAFKTKTNLTF